MNNGPQLSNSSLNIVRSLGDHVLSQVSGMGGGQWPSLDGDLGYVSHRSKKRYEAHNDLAGVQGKVPPGC